MAKIESIGVLGAGQMGGGIAQVAAAHGRKVILCDVDDKRAEAGKAKIAKILGRAVEKGKIKAEDRDATLDRIQTAGDVAALGNVDFAIEAATESIDLKRKLMRDLDQACKDGVILASNTSSISITLLGAETRRPQDVIGMHFMNPVPVMQLVEVIRGHATSDATTTTTLDIARALGKTPVEVNDYPGFVANRILMPMINKAVYTVMEGVATPEAVDTVMKLGMAHPMGPLALADFIGLDVCLAILEVMHRGLGDPKYRPCPLLRRMVAAGHLGRKSGRGFYEYGERK
jgi:3-hydroxybutyryl-CoA dehydrogenase